MNPTLSSSADLSDERISEATACLAVGEAVRLDHPAGLRLHVDRPLPFLCVYRAPRRGEDPGTGDFVLGEASFLWLSAAMQEKRCVARLIESVATAMCERFGGFLIVEVWSAGVDAVRAAIEESALEPTELRPAFRVFVGDANAPLQAIESLQRRLERISYMRQRAMATIVRNSGEHPPALEPLLGSGGPRSAACPIIGLEVRPIYRDVHTGDLFPDVLRTLRIGVGRALKQALFTFSKTRTTAQPEHFYSLGRRTAFKGVKRVDRRLSEVSDSFQFLLQVTPVKRRSGMARISALLFRGRTAVLLSPPQSRGWRAKATPLQRSDRGH